MGHVATVPVELTWAPFTVREAMRSGLTRRQLRSSAWRRIGHGVYICAEAGRDDLVRLTAASLRLPAQAVFSGPSAAWLHGLEVAPCSPITVTLDYDQPVADRSGVLVHRARLPPGEVTVRRGLQVTSALRAIADCCRRLPLIPAMIALDMALHSELVTAADLEAVATRSAGRPYVSRLRRALGFAEPKAESPMETRLRMALLLAGLPRPEAQVEIRDAGGEFIARPDLLYPAARVAIEYDGEVHRNTLTADNRRQNRLLAAGYTVLRFSAGDLQGGGAAVVEQVRAALFKGHFSKTRR